MPVAWFEFLLNPARLEDYLKEENPGKYQLFYSHLYIGLCIGTAKLQTLTFILQRRS